MKIKVENWTLRDLIKFEDEINPKPQYQRTSVWQVNKKKLLIDSILRGYDIPKFYLRETPNDPSFKYEVTDGQQRIRSIWEFSKNEFKLDEAIISGINFKGFDYSELEKNVGAFNDFLKYEINIAVIKEATQEEIRTLFARLQMGDRLNPAELRHALASNIGNAINSIVDNHPFFGLDCKIPNSRYKHQDYLDNAITLSYYMANRNIKAADMKHLYTDFGTSSLNDMQPLLKKINSVLTFMESINKHRRGIFKNKWAFVDIFYLIYMNLDKVESIKEVEFADNLNKFEVKRKKYNSRPENLIEDKANLEYDKDLYDYIIAFNTSGSDKNNAKIRFRVMFNKFFNQVNFNIVNDSITA